RRVLFRSAGRNSELEQLRTLYLQGRHVLIAVARCSELDGFGFCSCATRIGASRTIRPTTGKARCKLLSFIQKPFAEFCVSQVEARRVLSAVKSPAAPRVRPT